MRTLYRWFAASVTAVPDATALVVGDRTLTYAQLDRMVAGLAGELHRGSRVGLLASRSVAAYAAYLAICRAGAVVVPLNPAYPPERNRSVATLAGLDRILLTDGAGQESLGDLPVPVLSLDDGGLSAPSAAALSKPPAQVSPDDLAYILFTSGSTGRPKAVPIRGRNLDAFLRYNIARYRVRPGCRLSQTFDLTFDPSVFDMFVAWGAGATLVVPTRDELYDPVGFVNSRAVTHWYSVPSLITIAQAADMLPRASLPHLRYSLFAGEQLTLDQATAWADAAPASIIENLYGPTELSVTVSTYRLPADRAAWPVTSNGTVPIGDVYPHLHHRIRQGELQVRGPQRFAGYLDPSDNAGRFVEPTGRSCTGGPSAEAWYRTGDRVGVEAGTLVHLGRLDHQVKILGQRVEPAEVEAALRHWAGVPEVVVLATPRADGHVELAAVYSGPVADPGQLRDRLRQYLPQHMVPRRFVHLPNLPLNHHGKVDRLACADHVRQHPR